MQRVQKTSETSHHSLSAVFMDPPTMRLQWGDGHVSTFHYIWLRDNCGCTTCGRHDSGSRFQALLDIPDDIKPATVGWDSVMLRIRWEHHDHESSYDLGWLRRNCYSAVERARRQRSLTLWDASLQELPTVDFQLAAADRDELLRLFSSVSKFGVVVVRNVGIAPADTLRLAESIGYIRDTHFGRVSDLMLRPTGTHIADFPTQILPHTDETYRPIPTGINIFHCITPSADGGGASILVDSLRCVEELRSVDPSAFALLCSQPIQHERRTSGEVIRSNYPAIRIDEAGQVAEVRLNERTMSAISAPEELVESTYRAIRKLFRIAYDQSNWVSYRMKAGEALVFDNLRVLHGRTAFSAERLLRQTNVMRDEFYAKMAFLDELLAK